MTVSSTDVSCGIWQLSELKNLTPETYKQAVREAFDKKFTPHGWGEVTKFYEDIPEDCDSRAFELLLIANTANQALADYQLKELGFSAMDSFVNNTGAINQVWIKKIKYLMSDAKRIDERPEPRAKELYAYIKIME